MSSTNYNNSIRKSSPTSNDSGENGQQQPSSSTNLINTTGISIVIDSPKIGHGSQLSSTKSDCNSGQSPNGSGITDYNALTKGDKKSSNSDSNHSNNHHNPSSHDDVSFFEKLTKDTDSIVTGHSVSHRINYRSESKIRWWKHPNIKENWRVFAAAFGLLVVGIGLITMGIVVTVMPDIDFQSYVFFIAGAICFIPGAYHVVFMYCALTGRKGYDFHQLPLFQ